MRTTKVATKSGFAEGSSENLRGRRRPRVAPPGFQFEPPDGGLHAWMVVAGAGLAGMTIGLPQITFSFILNDVLEEMDAKTSTAAWIPSIISTVNMFSAPVCAIVVSKYSCRVAAMAGGLVSATGMVLSFFAPNIEVLFLTFGLLGGVGQGLVINADLLALSQYFRRRYSLALGIVIAFWACGRLIFSPLIQLMLDSTFDFRGVLLISGAISLHACVGASTFQPVEPHLVLVPINPDDVLPTALISGDGDTDCATTDPMLMSEEMVDSPKLGEIDCDLLGCNAQNVISNEPKKMALIETTISPGVGSHESKIVSRKPNSHATINGIALPKPSTRVNGLLCRKVRGIGSSICRILDFSLFSQPLFYILLTSRLVGNVSSMYPVIFLPPYLITKGLEPMEAATVASILAGAEIAGRIVNPWVQSHFRLSVVYFFIVLSALQGITLFGLVFVSSFSSIAVLVVISGIFHGGCVAFSLVVMLDCFGPSKLSSVLALTKPLQGVVSLGVGPIIGYVRDQTGNYDLCYSVFGGLRFLVSIIWCLKPLVMRRVKETTILESPP